MQETQEKKLRKTVEKIAVGDKKTIDTYLRKKPEDMKYKVSKTQSTVRNFRDFEIYTAMKAEETQPYGEYQKVVDYVTNHRNIYGEVVFCQSEAGKLTVDRILSNLCKYQMENYSFSSKELQMLAEHLNAGEKQDNKEINQDICNRMKEEGRKALRDVYLRQLEELQSRYGGNYLLKLSPSDYLKKYGELSAAFACLDDIKLFFSGEEENNLPVQARGLLNYFENFWEALKQRHQDFVNGDFDGKADENYKKLAKSIVKTAVEEKLFTKPFKVVIFTMDSYFQTKQEQSEKAVKAIKKYENDIEKMNLLDRELTKKAEPYKQIINAYKRYQKDKVLLSNAEVMRKEKEQGEHPDITMEYIEGIIKECSVAIEEYEKKGVPSSEAIETVEKKIDQILSPVTYHFEEVTLENFAQLSDDFLRRVDGFCHLISNISDEELLKRYSELCKEGKSLKKEEDTIKESNVYSKAGTTYKDKELIHETRKKLDGISKKYPIFNKTVDIMEARLLSIQKYGYTNTETLTKTEDREEVLSTIREKYVSAEKNISRPMSLKEALEVKIGGDRFGNLKNINFSTIFRELEACRRVVQFRENQPDYYHLGLSFADYEKAEAMCQLLPLCEKALETTLLYTGIKKHGQVSVATLEEEWREAAGQFYRKAYRIDVDYGVKKFQITRVEQREANKRKLEEREELWEEGTTTDEKQEVLHVADIFLDPIHIQNKEELRDAKNVVTYQNKIFATNQEIEPSEAEFKSLSIFLYEAVLLFEQVEEKLKKDSYRDHAMFSLREDIFKCERKFFWLNMIFDSQLVRDNFLQKYRENPAMEALAHALSNFNEISTKVKGIADYVGGMEMQYALRNGVKTMKTFCEGIDITFTEQGLKEEGEKRKRKGEKVVESLRIKKETDERKEEIFRNQMESRLRKAVGKEIIARDTKVFMANLKTARSMQSLGGNLIGTPLQIFSWIKHERRTADHGSCAYEKWSDKYKEFMTIMGSNHEMNRGSLPQWHRGTSPDVPPLDLEELFGSPLKKWLNQQIGTLDGRVLDYQEDFAEYEFKKSIEAISRYSTVVGIVNSDTTEMEMAFLDMFYQMAGKYERYNFASEDRIVMQRLQLLRQMKEQLNNTLKPTLKDTMTGEELEYIVENTTAYVENTMYRENMEESNIQDIPIFLHEPNINDVKQSSIGDCWLVSAISALVKSSPEYIKSMFHDTGDGNVIVRLYETERNGKIERDENLLLSGNNIKTYPCYFKLRKQYETGWGNASDCTWVQLIEKAYALGGFNGRREMKVQGNQLYNVTDELTYGHQGVALYHLTGILPEELEKHPIRDFSENSFFDGNFIAAALDGLSENLQVVLADEIFSMAKENTINGIETIIDLVQKRQISEEEKQFITEKICENFRKMKTGFQSETYDSSKKTVNAQRGLYTDLEKNKTFSGKEEEMKLLYRLARYFDVEKNESYSAKETMFYQECKDAFSQGTTLSVAIPHCVDLLDAKESNGRLFILLRDPFNIYNNEYVREGEKEVTREERFTKVISGHRENRRLMGDKDEILRNGFRGTSWFDVKDLYPIIYGMYKAPVGLQAPDYKQQN